METVQIRVEFLDGTYYCQCNGVSLSLFQLSTLVGNSKFLAILDSTNGMTRSIRVNHKKNIKSHVGQNGWVDQQLLELIKSLLPLSGPIVTSYILSAQFVLGCTMDAKTLYKVLVIDS